VISIPFHIVRIRMERNSYWSSITESHYSEHWKSCRMKRRYCAFVGSRARFRCFSVRDSSPEEWEEKGQRSNTSSQDIMAFATKFKLQTWKCWFDLLLHRNLECLAQEREEQLSLSFKYIRFAYSSKSVMLLVSGQNAALVGIIK
jgi:hypothetical protein